MENFVNLGFTSPLWVYQRYKKLQINQYTHTSESTMYDINAEGANAVSSST